MRLKLRPLRTLEVVSYSGPSPLFLPNHPSINSSIKLSSNLLILLSLILKNFIIVSFNLDLTHSNTVSQTISILSLSSVSSSFNSINQSTHPPFKPQVVYQRILQLTYISDLLDSLQSLLVSLYAPLLSSLFSHSGLPQAFHSVLKTWDLRFTQLLKQIESSSSQPRPSSRLPNPPEPDHHHASDMSLGT